jgi:hypothetical protein
MYQERSALIDRIEYFKTTARRSNDNWPDGPVDFTRKQIAYATARLERINTMIARSEHSPLA